MGGTTEHAGNFVPVDERLVSFFVSQNQECRGRNPLPVCEVKPKTSFTKPGVQRTKSFAGVWGVPTNFFFSLAAAGGKKGPNHYE